MHESRLTWDTAKLRNVFEEEEVQRILAIPILMIRNFDKLSQHYTRHGQYAVNSDCYIAKKYVKTIEEQGQAGSGPQSIARMGSFWKLFWKLKVPKKIIVFLWRMVKDKLPSHANLNRLMPHIPMNYEHCGKVETCRHFFFKCPKAIEVWLHSPLELRASKLSGITAQDV